MSPEKKIIYMQTRRDVRWMYRFTDHSISQIARMHRISVTKANNMIEANDKEPQWFRTGEYP